MRKIRFGRTDVEVPAIGFGTWGHSGEKKVKGRPVGWSGHDDEEATAALLTAWELGLTHWDTADVYGDGRAEQLIGALWQRGVARDEVFLATKVGWDAGGFPHAYHPTLMRRRLERSLSYLHTGAVDLYYLHHCDFGPRDEYLDDAIASLHRFREEGKIRFIGLSDWKPEKILRYADRVDPEVVQPYRNVVDDDYAASGLAAWVAGHDAGVAFFSPLKHGLLLGKHEEPPDLGPGDHRRRIPQFRDPEALAHYRACRQAAEERFAGHPQPVLHALTGALLADSPTGCCLLGLRRPHHAEAAAAIGHPLSPDEAEWVRRLYRGEARNLPGTSP